MSNVHSPNNSFPQLDDYRKKAQLGGELRKIGTRAAAAAAAFSAVSLSGAEPLQAQIVDSGINNTSATVFGLGSTSLRFDLNQDGIDDGAFSLRNGVVLSSAFAPAAASLDPVSSFQTFRNASFRQGKKKVATKKALRPGIVATSSSFGAANLSAGFLIQQSLATGAFYSNANLAISKKKAKKKKVAKKKVASSSSSSTTSSFGIYPFQFGAPGIAGINFQTSSGETRFGWLRVQFDFSQGLTPAGNEFSVRIFEGFYDASGNGIRAGATAIPEPGSFSMLGLLAMGSIGLREMRRRKRDVPPVTPKA